MTIHDWPKGNLHLNTYVYGPFSKEKAVRLERELNKWFAHWGETAKAKRIYIAPIFSEHEPFPKVTKTGALA